MLHINLVLISVNCVDRHLEKSADSIALIWEKDEPGTEEFITYRLGNVTPTRQLTITHLTQLS